MEYELCIDWAATDWSDDPDFTDAEDDVTSYMQSFHLDRGTKVESGNAPAGTMQVELSDPAADFAGCNGASPYSGFVRPWLPIRLRVKVGVNWYALFSGFISRLHSEPHLNKVKCVLYCTDGTDLLARQIARQQLDERSAGTDGDAMAILLDVAGWSATRRALDTDGGSIVQYPKTVVY
jgi:hypothetical protein